MSRKYLYRVYTNSIGESHCERLHIIYQNSEFTYYRQHGSTLLGYTANFKIKETILEATSTINGYYYEEPPKDFLDSKSAQRKMIELRAKIQDYNEAIQYHQQNIAVLQDRVIRLLKESNLSDEEIDNLINSKIF